MNGRHAAPPQSALELHGTPQLHWQYPRLGGFAWGAAASRAQLPALAGVTVTGDLLPMAAGVTPRVQRSATPASDHMNALREPNLANIAPSSSSP